MALLSLQNLSLSYGAQPLLDAVNLQIERGERVALLGRNGSGKSTLLRVLEGDLAPQNGAVVRERGVQIARLPQEVPGEASGSVREVVAGQSGAPDHEIAAIISRLQLPDAAPYASLSGGLKRRAWLGRLLASQPDILLLDEPTNHLDMESIAWLEEFLARGGKTLLFVTHDRVFLQKVATRIVEVDRGQLLNWECDFATYQTRKEAALEAESRQNTLFDKRLGEEEAWIRRGVEARRTKAQSRIRALEQMRAERRARRDKLGVANLRAQDAEKSGRLVIEAQNLEFSYPNRPIVQDFSTVIMRGDKIGLIGPNGSGKTTLLRLLLGELEAQNGSVRHGTNLQIAYFDQLRAQLDEEKSVQWNICGENSTVTVNGQAIHIVGYLRQWLFDADRAKTPVKWLSGGERNRLLLAKQFTQPANLLVMDEPTNDLDAETLELLETLLVEFPGTLLLVSHDRAFLNNVLTGTLAFEADGVKEYIGGYDDWLRQKPKSGALDAQKSPEKAPKTAARPRKLSWNETRELEGLPAKIEALETGHAALVEKMGDPEFYQGVGAAIAEATEKLATFERDLAAAFARWEELLSVEQGS